MKRIFVLTILTIIFITACSKVPVTGRRQMNLLPESQMVAMSLAAYKDFLKDNKPIGGSDAQMVKRAGSKISNAVKLVLKGKKEMKRIQGFNWEFNLVEDEAVNAWCMPGGKVVIYTGILPITKSENGLAVVMSHEVAHAVARHGNERMSQSLSAQLGGLALGVALSSQKSQTVELFNQAYGLGSTLGILKFSRKHESEADKMGLVFMAAAGYNPREAVPFWQRMAANSKGQAPPEFLSTHPSNATRIKDLNAFMPKALKYYKRK